ncbi:MAG: SufE family protein [Alphaproteobacteria bacterium]|nr:SufE family protein [Alphaproteobacteria bacterium]
MTIEDRAKAVESDFALLEDWEARFSYIIELGRSLSPLTPDELCEANRVKGCSSQVWLVSSPSETVPGAIAFRGASDALIVAGLTALVIGLYSDLTPKDILSFDAEAFFRRIGVAEALTPQRSNGLKSMLARIRAEAGAKL